MANSTPTPPAPHATDPVTQTLALLQPWIEYVPQRQRRLGRFIFIALLVHIVAFYFIRIDTTRAELRHPTRIHVSVEYPQAVAVDGAPADDFWDRLTDPRVFLLPLKPLATFTTDQPSLGLNSNLGSKDLPAATPEVYRTARSAVTPLDVRINDAMQPPRQPFHYDEKTPSVAAQTTWQWDATLAARQPTGAPALPSPISDIDLTPTVLSVAVNASGAVEHVMVEQSCGGDFDAPIAPIAKDLNQQAVLAARKTRFQPTNTPGLQWGRMTVFWHYTAKPREEVVPTPPSTAP
jgi:hypothetical protein